MHPLFSKADQLSRVAIGAAIEVHRHKGPGLIESIYEKWMMWELSLRNVAAVNQRVIKIEYKGMVFDEPLRFDVLVEDCLLLELKSVQEVLPIHKAQLVRACLRIPLLRSRRREEAEISQQKRSRIRLQFSDTLSAI